jgi:hypothetical protein
MVERFVGLDVSQRLTSVCILDEQGKRVWRGKARSGSTSRSTSSKRTARMRQAK